MKDPYYQFPKGVTNVTRSKLTCAVTDFSQSSWQLTSLLFEEIESCVSPHPVDIKLTLTSSNIVHWYSEDTMQFHRDSLMSISPRQCIQTSKSLRINPIVNSTIFPHFFFFKQPLLLVPNKKNKKKNKFNPEYLLCSCMLNIETTWIDY